MDITVSFPGGLRVDAEADGRVIATDQAPESGGEGSAPEPYTLFLASLATCAGIYVLRFCQARKLPTEGLAVRQRAEFHPETDRLEAIRMDISVPEGFPEKYREALVRAAEKCAVKRAVLDPPAFHIRTVG